jgi:hypothetical protein
MVPLPGVQTTTFAAVVSTQIGKLVALMQALVAVPAPAERVTLPLQAFVSAVMLKTPPGVRLAPVLPLTIAPVAP